MSATSRRITAAFLSLFVGAFIEQEASAASVSSERSTGPPVSVDAPGVQSPNLIFDGTAYYLVWLSDRVPLDSIVGNSSAVLLGARLGRDGVAIDPYGVALAQRGSPWGPKVASTGAEYVVTWQSNIPPVGPAGLRAIWLDKAGQPEGPDTQVASVAGRQTSAVACTSASVVSRKVFTEAKCLLAFIDRSGVVNGLRGSLSHWDPMSALALVSSPHAHDLSLTSIGGSELMLAWMHLDASSSLVTTRWSAMGTVSSPSSSLVSDACCTSLTSSGHDLLASWLVAGPRSLHVMALDLDGHPLSSDRVVANAQHFSMTWTGESYLAVWTNQGVMAQMLGVDGNDGVPASALSDPALRYPAVAAASPDRALIVADNTPDPLAPSPNAPASTPNAALIDPRSGATVAQLGFFKSANRQAWPVLAAGASGYLLAWLDGETGGLGQFVGERLTPDGSVIDKSPLVIGAAETVGDPDLQAGWLGNQYAITYRSASGHSGVLLDEATGTMTPLPFPAALSADTIAFGDASLLALTKEGMFAGEDNFVRQVFASGVALDGTPTARQLIGTDMTTRTRGIVFQDGNYVVTAACEFGICATRVSPQGQPLDTSPLTVSTPRSDVKSGVTAIDMVPAAAIGPDGMLVAWARKTIDDLSGESSSYSVMCARISRDFQLLDQHPIVLAQRTGNRAGPLVDYDGQAYVVAWEKLRTPDDAWGIDAAHVAPDGSVLEPEGFPVASGPSDAVALSLGARADHRALVAYHRFDADPAYVSSRVRYRLIGPGLSPLGAGCHADADCERGHCVDSICCDTPCTDACMSCSADVKGAGSDGICEALRDPTKHPMCACSGSACAKDVCAEARCPEGFVCDALARACVRGSTVLPLETATAGGGGCGCEIARSTRASFGRCALGLLAVLAFRRRRRPSHFADS